MIDNSNKKKIIIYSDILRGFVIVTLAVLLLFKIDYIVFYYLAMIILGITSSLFKPAINSTIVDIADENNMEKENAKINNSGFIADILGNAFCSYAFSLISPVILVFMNGISYIYSAITEIFLKIPYEKKERKNNYLSDLLLGYKYVMGEKALLIFIGFCMSINFFLSMIDILYLPYFETTSSFGVKGYSYAMMAFSSFVNNDMPCVVEDYYAGAVDIIKCICIILCVSVKLLDVHWLLALVIVGSSILITAIPNTMRKYVGKVRGKYGAAMEDYNGAQHSLLSGANTVKVTGFDKRARDIIQEKNEAIVSEEKKLNKSQLRVVGVAGGMQILKRVLILAVGVYLIYIDAIKVGGLLVAVQLAEVLAMPAEMLAYMQNARNQAKPLVEKYDKLTSVEDDLGQTKLQDIQNISVEHLSYEINDVKIIKDFSYTFEKGKKYMLTGPSGCGKSTFLSLLEKLQEGTYGGSVRINDVSLNDVSSASLYEKIGVAFQEPYLFGFSLKENIIMGRDVSDSDYAAVMKKLNLDYLLDRFANNELNTEMVSRLSGGEKQRIALARAMVGKPQVYMLDEITSSLDEQNAREIEEILLAEDATILYVCHKIIPELKDRYEEVAFA